MNSSFNILQGIQTIWYHSNHWPIQTTYTYSTTLIKVNFNSLNVHKITGKF